MMFLFLNAVNNFIAFSKLFFKKVNKIRLSQFPIFNKINFGGAPFKLII